MTRSVRDSNLETRTARGKLKPRGKPYYRALDQNLHVGYRKLKVGGKWVARRYVGKEQYTVETIGTADDFADADGVETLTFHQAQARVRERAGALAEEKRIASLGTPLTVRDAIEEYLVGRDSREASMRGGFGLKRDARSRLTKHVLTANERLAAKPLASLTTDDLALWRHGLRMASGSVQRTVNDFKAALNSIARRAKIKLPVTMRDTIKEGLATDHAAPAVAREAQVLPDGDVRTIIAAAFEVDADGEWGGDLGRLVLVLAATGGRFSQIARMVVADVQVAQRRLMIPVSRKGRGVKNATHTGIRVGDDVLAALASITEGRKDAEPLFLRPHWRQLSPAVWKSIGRGRWKNSSELTRPWRKIVAKAGLHPETVPYALRHSSIVRGLRAGLPVRLVAALHDTGAQTIERHYAAFIVDAMDELAATAVVPLTTAPAAVT